MELPYSLQTLPPEAVDILRYYASISTDAAHADAIVDGAGLSERGFGKGIRRLVTKNYLVMSSDQVYRLTEQGRRLIDELQGYDSEALVLSPVETDDVDSCFLPFVLRRRMHALVISGRHPDRLRAALTGLPTIGTTIGF